MKITALSVLLVAALASSASAAAAAPKAAAAAPKAKAPTTPAPAPAKGAPASGGAPAAPASGGAPAAPAAGGTPPATPGGLTGYPTMDVPPPTNQPWFRKADLSKVPNIPPRKAVDDCVKGAPDPNCAWSCTGCTRSTDFVFCPKQGDWGLSFDDGPSHSSTNKLMDYLDTVPEVKASFFILGSRVVEFPETLLRTFKAGHHIGVHTWSHTALTTQTNEQIVAEILWTEKIIHEVTGVTPKWIRPPYGDIDDRVRAIMTAYGYTPALWNRDTNDFTSGTDKTFQLEWIPANFTQWVSVDAKSATTGFCSLEHDILMKTVSVVPQNVPILVKGGMKPQPVSTCSGDTNPYQVVANGTAGAAPLAGATSAGTASNSSTSATNAKASGSAAAAPTATGGASTIAGGAFGALVGVAIAALTFL